MVKLATKKKKTSKCECPTEKPVSSGTPSTAALEKRVRDLERKIEKQHESLLRVTDRLILAAELIDKRNVQDEREDMLKKRYNQVEMLSSI